MKTTYYLGMGRNDGKHMNWHTCESGDLWPLPECSKASPLLVVMALAIK